MNVLQFYIYIFSFLPFNSFWIFCIKFAILLLLKPSLTNCLRVGFTALFQFQFFFFSLTNKLRKVSKIELARKSREGKKAYTNINHFSSPGFIFHWNSLYIFFVCVSPNIMGRVRGGGDLCTPPPRSNHVPCNVQFSVRYTTANKTGLIGYIYSLPWYSCFHDDGDDIEGTKWEIFFGTRRSVTRPRIFNGLW